jgi:hypothetical protein
MKAMPAGPEHTPRKLVGLSFALLLGGCATHSHTSESAPSSTPHIQIETTLVPKPVATLAEATATINASDGSDVSSISEALTAQPTPTSIAVMSPIELSHGLCLATFNIDKMADQSLAITPVMAATSTAIEQESATANDDGVVTVHIDSIQTSEITVNDLSTPAAVASASRNIADLTEAGCIAYQEAVDEGELPAA